MSFEVMTDEESQDSPDEYSSAIPNEQSTSIDWIIDTGASEHFVNDLRLLQNRSQVNLTATVANGEKVKIIMKGDVMLKSILKGQEKMILLSDVVYSPVAPRNLISVGKINGMGYEATFRNGVNYIRRISTQESVLKYTKQNKLWIMKTTAMLAKEDKGELHAAMVQEDTLANLHRRMGHIPYNKIIKMSKNPDSRIVITDYHKPYCFESPIGKQSRNNQPAQDSGTHSPIDEIGGVVCSDIKGKITPRDRNGNNYLINFIASLTITATMLKSI
jgi:hypothetical protein